MPLTILQKSLKLQSCSFSHFRSIIVCWAPPLNAFRSPQAGSRYDLSVVKVCSSSKTHQITRANFRTEMHDDALVHYRVKCQGRFLIFIRGYVECGYVSKSFSLSGLQDTFYDPPLGLLNSREELTYQIISKKILNRIE